MPYNNEMLDPISPGEILKEEFLVPLSMSANQLAKELDISTNRISDILRGRRSITADTALRLERHFGLEAQFWLNLQASYDLRLARASAWTQIRTSVRRRAA